jgi:hypothetical protein
MMIVAKHSSVLGDPVQVSWLKDQGFGGVMIWSIDMDDFRGHCGTGRYPLLTAIREELDNYTVRFVYDGPYERSAASLIAKGKAKDREFTFLPPI